MAAPFAPGSSRRLSLRCNRAISWFGSHKVAGIAAAIESVGAQVRYLPPYSPDYNPIEQVFAKFKTLLRKNAARTMDALWVACGALLDQFPAAECARYICHAGYGQSG